MGVVLEAFDLQLHRKVAIKFVNSASFDEDSRQHFVQEARAMALVNHPNVLVIHAFGEHGSVPYFVMELVDGQTVESWLERNEWPSAAGRSSRHLERRLPGRVRDSRRRHGALRSEAEQRALGRSAARPSRRFGPGRSVRGWRRDQGDRGHAGIHGAGIGLREGRAREHEQRHLRARLHGIRNVDRKPALRRAHRARDHGQACHRRASATEPAPPRFAARPSTTCCSKALRKRPQDRFASADLFRRALKEARASSVEPVRILVAEDDADFRDLLALKLGMEFPDADIVCVENGRDLVDCLRREKRRPW